MKSFKQFFLEYRHNLADGTPSQSIQATNGKDPNRVLGRKHSNTQAKEYQALNPKTQVIGAIFAGQELAKLMNEYGFNNYDTGTIHKIKNSGNALQIFQDVTGKPTGKIIKLNSIVK